MTDFWHASSNPILLSVRRSYPVAVSKYGTKRVDDNLANPSTKVDMVAFDGMVIEPYKEHANIWQFRIVGDNKVEGRPTGGSRRDHNNAFVVGADGKKRRRKQGEWYDVDWVPADAIKAAVINVGL